MSSASIYKDNLKYFIHQEICYMSLMLGLFDKEKYFHFLTYEHLSIEISVSELHWHSGTMLHR